MHADRARAAFVQPGGDHLTLLNVWEQWVHSNYDHQFCIDNFVQPKVLARVRDVRDQLSQLCERVELTPESNADPSDISGIQRSILAGYFMNTARIQKGGEAYRTIKQNTTIHIHPSSCLYKHIPQPPFLCFFELVETSKNFMRQVMQIRPEWLLEVAKHYFTKEDVQHDANRKVYKGQTASAAALAGAKGVTR